jgi:hypothetical protein
VGPRASVDVSERGGGKLAPTKIQTPDFPDSSLVAILTMLLWFLIQLLRQLRNVYF